jgi:hypothetical protein
VCGTVGLFIGCAALSYCPRQQLLATRTTPAEPYRSPFQRWHERATVRQAPRRMLSDGDASEHVFAPELVPVASHPLVAALPPERFELVLASHLVRYLEFTAVLETLVVNRVALGVARGTIGVPLPPEMRFDAYKIYCDEAYHALFSVDLARQVTAELDVPGADAEPMFLRRLRELLERTDPALRNLVELLFVVVSETLISATLTDLPSDAGVRPAVRDVVRDHALDEGRHHAYFAAFLRHLWPALSPAERRAAGRLVPALIRCFLLPDADGVAADLRRAGLSAEQAEAVVTEVFSPEAIGDQIRATAAQTIRCFAEVGVLDEPGALEEFQRAALIPSVA